MAEDWRDKQTESVALLRELEKEWGATEFEQRNFGNFTGAEVCEMCGKRWKKSGMHLCAPVEFREAYTERYLKSRGSAVALALEALWRWRGDYAYGHNAWKKGQELMFEVTGEAERDHMRYEELTRAIEALE